jgi:hypothetical protein
MNESNELGIAKKRGRPKKVDLKYQDTKLKVSKRKIAKIEGETFNRAAWGKEPEWDPKQKSHYNGTKPDGSDTLGFALNWYSVNSSQDKLKKWTIEYLETKKFPAADLAVLSSIAVGEKSTLFGTIGALSRCVMRGAKISKEHLENIITYSKQLVRDNKPTKAEVLVMPAPARKFDNAQRKLMEAIESITDDYLVSRNTAVLANFNFKRAVIDSHSGASQVRKVLDSYEPRARELQEALSGDKELKEAYSHLTPKQITILINFYTKVLTEGLEVAPKQQRKPRRKKVKTAEQILKKFQFAKEFKDGNFRIDSADPKDILGADEVWTFNIKTRKLGFFKAKENEKLTIKGTSMQNFDEEKSFCKKLRKPAEQLAQVKTLSKPAIKKYVMGIRSKEALLRSRINADTILVRAF